MAPSLEKAHIPKLLRKAGVVELVTAPTVISIDPGGTLGWSVMVVHPDALVDKDVPILTNILHRANGQIRAIPPTHGNKAPKALELSLEERRCIRTLIGDVLGNWAGAAMVIEDFLLRKKVMDRELLSPVRLTAALELAIEYEGLHMTLQRQSPSEAKTAATDARLKEWGLYSRAGGMEHARDADRHSITFLRKAKARGSVRGDAWPHLYTPSGELRPVPVAA